MQESLERAKHRAKLAQEDDREEYKNRMKMGKKRYDEFMKEKEEEEKAK